MPIFSPISPSLARRVNAIQLSVLRQIYDQAPAGSINLGLGEPDVPLPEVIRKATEAALAGDRLGYTPNAGLGEVREVIAAYQASITQVGYGRDNVCVTSGAQEALYTALMALVNPGDEVLIPDPGFLAYLTLVRLAGGYIKTYPLPAVSGFAFDREAFAASLSPRTRLVIFNSPSNPTGTVFSREDWQFVADRLSRHRILAITDEVYREIYADQAPPSLAEVYDGTLVVSSLSKMLGMTGWRLGWAAGPKDVVRAVTVMHQYVTTCASTLSQRAALAAFTPAGLAAVQEIRETLQQRRQILQTGLAQMDVPFAIGQGAFYGLVDVSALGDDVQVAVELLKECVITVPGSAFGTQSTGFLRLSFGGQPQNLREGLSRLKQGLARLHQSR
ncbi:MAG: aminotransferase class I/II-fold pyridoxal phosphate-dependent enzyme [Acidobacteria bacterium]|nr:aminotransferase class I/II-fold pyridoxal phosphate-dependent enzyme [Acidobacteriota bacterium]